jgi:hypothetical protein
MDIPIFLRLIDPEGCEALRLAADLEIKEENFLAGWTALQRRGVEKDLARVALETALLRIRAAGKFSRAGEMFFTRDGLEQASAEPLSRHRAERFRGRTRIVDLGCGIGGDSIALAACAPVLAVDREEIRLRMARENVKAYAPAYETQFILTDLLKPGLISDGSAAPSATGRDTAYYCDPSRRDAESRRIFSVRRYLPPLEKILRWRGAGREAALCVKISPGVRWEEIEREDCEVEFVSWNGELKEAVLWYGPFQTVRRRATILPSGETMTGGEENNAISPPRRILYEPDPSVLRAGLVRQLATRLRAAQIDPEIAYLTADDFLPTPWAKAYRIEESMPFGLKRLREWLRARSVGKVIVKKRGSAIEPEALEQRLRLRGDRLRILFLTKAGGKPYVLIADEMLGAEKQDAALGMEAVFSR